MKKKFPVIPMILCGTISLSLLSGCFKNEDHSPVVEKEIQVAGFNKIYAGERFHVIAQKGDSFRVTVKGPSDSVNDIEWDVANQILEIHYHHQWNNHPVVDVVITLPDLVQVNLSGSATGIISGFQGISHVVRTVLSGSASCTVNGAGSSFQVDLSGSSQLSVNGNTSALYGNISGASKLQAYGLSTANVDISASGGSEARVLVTQRLDADASGGSKIYYRGNPATKNITTSGGAKVLAD